MPIAIAVTSADLVLPATDPHTPAAHVLTPPGGQDFPTALAEAAGLLDRHGYVIAVYPATTPRGYVQRLHAVRAMLESDRIALLPTSLPPLGAAVLVRQLRQLSVCDFSPGVLGAAARLLSHYIYAGALLGSASRTDRLPVPLPAVTGPRSSTSGPHAVLARPTAQLVRASAMPGPGRAAGAPGVGLAGPQFATTLTYATGQLGSEWVTGQLARQWQVHGVHPVPLPAQSPTWWRTNKLVEFAAAIQDASLLYQMVSSMRQEACHWCGFTLIGDRCAFCSAPVPAARGRVPRAIGGASGGGQRKALAR